MSAIDRWMPWIAGALLAVPVLVVCYPPMTDLPLFEGALSLLRHWGDPAFTPPGLYELNLGRTTQLGFALALPLTLVMSTAAACKTLVAACVVAIVVGVARLARHAGVTPWVALLAAPVALGWMVFIGFAAYLLGTALWLGCLPLLDRWAREPTPRRGAAVGAVVVLLHLAHLASSACVVVAIAILSLAYDKRRLLLRLAPAALAVALALADRHADRAHVGASALGWEQRGMVWPPLRIKVGMVLDYLFGAVGGMPEVLAAGLVVIALAAAVFTARGQRSPQPHDAEPRTVRWRFAALALVLLGAYLVSPWAIGGGAYFDARFLPPAWLVGIVAVGRAAPCRLPVLPRALAACVPVGWLLVVWPAFADADREQRTLEHLYPLVAPASAVAVTSLGDDASGQPYLHVSAGNRVLAERGGRMLFSLAEAPRAPALIAPRSRWDESVARLYTSGPLASYPSFDATRFRYMLVRVSNGDLARLAVAAFAPDYRLEGAAGAWLLLGSTHPTVPLGAADAAPPPGMPTLQDRIAALTRSR